ncbi:MAG: DUF2267 domain-containing protein [Pseudomonadota bacterium]
MPMPMEYWTASKDFEAFLDDVRASCMLTSHHQAYHTLRAVLHVFRAHLDVQDALSFAAILPPVVRAIFVEDWSTSSPLPFPDRETLVSEVKAIRRDHNLAPDTAIEDVAGALRRSMDCAVLDRALSGLPDGAAAYWAVGSSARKT